MPNSAAPGMARRQLLAATAAALAASPLGARAQAPRPMRFVIPYPPGGPTDILGRVVAQRLGQDLGQTIVIDNRAGASGVIGSQEVARAAPDGQTWLVNASIHTIIPHLQKTMPFDTLADFAPVTNIAAVPLIVVVTPSLPVKTIPELVAYLKANPGKLSFGSSGNGAAPHLAGELFKLLTGTEMTHIPYRGSGPALQDLMAGNIQVMFDSMPSSAGAVRDAQIRALAVTTRSRIAAFPDLPTVAEAGVPGYEIATWYGIWAPARTPAVTVLQMQQAVARAVAVPEVKERLTSLGADPVADDPDAFARFVRAEYDRWGKLVRDARITAD
jgi:tripartite-type tricarboxylate transporter receptor subunit TctC